MLLSTFCWAANIIAGKVALVGFQPLALAQLRMLGAAILYGLLVLLRHGSKPLAFRRSWLLLTIMALLGVTLNQILFNNGLARTSATHAGLIQAFGPVMVLAISSVLRLEGLTATKLGGMIVAFSGIVWLLGERVSSNMITGGLLILGGVYLTEHEQGPRKHLHHLARGGM